ncbi:2,3-bisphosphoglycerate-independent phosphoglycerate mutase [Acidisarcina polymorpha]|uniref:2,3-bisphosphoglycerate-independent phosphoglycerate mutase n=1 Tax=Acidisarcina polymorpha TaxID=2211140 RepID=A0A2Z5FS29_9BACT|nr:2,3-bisphosphoglycerate-independent phosphoglycerate mutase [Acidisarcina polymorpha]AXC09552.1 2,3-bisphosphoglycerate-independent phosphoglycerate mutase [Acidisarcina polymorpha]
MSIYKKPLVLAILDGWGYRAETAANAIAMARKPVYDKLLADFPNTLLHASNHFVGLPDGQMGNSEVGHLNIGAGRIVHMDITRIDALIASGEFSSDPVIASAIKHAGEGRRQLHLLGLLSDGGVHSHQRHLYAFLKAAADHGLQQVFVHVFLDGRDTAPTGGAGYIAALQQKFLEFGVGQIASVSGRYYAMDRDRRWEREKKTFDAMVKGSAEGGAYADPIARVNECYHNGITDEFIIPFVVSEADGQPVGVVRDEDVCINFNFRADRARQITRVLARNSGLTKVDGADLPGAAELDETIPRAEVPHHLHYVCMTQYDKQFTLPVVIPPESMENILANVLAQANLRNLRIAETEKYAHVTYFFNGGIETPFPGEDRFLVPSKKVATYDLAPEMSAEGIADAVIKAVDDTAFDLVVVNFANADMVGHSGKIEPTIKAVETVDTQLGRIYQALKHSGGSLLITADHGNAELMIDPVTGGPHTAHTTNPVPFILVNEDAAKYTLRPGGSLRDLSPTVLGILGLERPNQMTGGDLRLPKS